MSIDNRKYALVKREPMSRGSWAVFICRLILLCLTSPLAAYAYLRAMHIEGFYNPREFTQALKLRLGRNARLHSFDPLQPKPVAKLVYKLGSPPLVEGQDNAVGETNG